MGLDMYAYATRRKLPSDVDFIQDNEDINFHYWRKHPNLHGWMERLYRQKGGKNASFNCTGVVLTSEDLDALEADVNAGKLPHTEGFFFGETDGSEKEDDLLFIRKARGDIAGGMTVYYTSWW